MEDQGRGIKVEVRGSRSGREQGWGSRSGVNVGGQGLGVEVVVKVGGQDRWRGQGWGVKVLGGVKVWGFKVVVKVVGSRSWGQGQGYDQWSQSRGQCRGSKSGVNEGQGLGSWGQMVGWVYCGGEVVDK